jgi:hypothetical protein
MTIENKETPMRKAVGFIAVTGGAPLVALAIGAPTAWAAPTTGSTGNGASVSINGNMHGSPNSSSTAFSSPPGISKPNVAVAVNGSNAQAISRLGNGGSTAIAINNSSAAAFAGSNNTAVAINNSHAIAAGGEDSTATAINNSSATALHNGTATATCGGSATADNGQTVTSNGGSCGK